MSPAPKGPDRIIEIGLSWFLEGSSFDPVRTFVAVARFAEADQTGVGSLDT